MLVHSTRPCGFKTGDGNDRQCLRCSACGKHLAEAVNFSGRVVLRCRACKLKTSFDRVGSGEIVTKPRAKDPDQAVEFCCADCSRVLLFVAAFEGSIERICPSCKRLNRLSGSQQAEAIRRKWRPLAWSKEHVAAERSRWSPETLIPLLEDRWETFVREKRRAQAELAVGLRFDVFNRDGFRCRYCGRSVDEGLILHADHVIPKSKGGPTTLDNLVTACLECNLGKSDKVLIPVA